MCLCVTGVNVVLHLCTLTSPVRVLFPGVVDEMALALELSRRDGTSPQKPPLQNRSPGDSERGTQRSFSSAPYFRNTGVPGSSEDDEDEDLQMALACSLSEMEAHQRAAAPDFISGAGGGVRAVLDNSSVSAAVSHKAGAEGPDEGGRRKGDSGNRCGAERKRTSADSSTAASTGSGKKKNKCGCSVC